VAQALGRPVANTYKTIESLQHKGAILLDEGSTRLYRAIPVDDLLAGLDRNFSDRISRAEAELARLPSVPNDDRVYQLTGADQVFARCRSMIAKCETVVLVDAGPHALEQLRPELTAAARAGVDVIVKAYRPEALDGAKVLINPHGEALLHRYGAQWIVLVVDGAEKLIAFFSADGRDLVQGIWTGSAYLSWILHTSLAAEFMLTEWFEQIEKGTTADELRAAFHPMLFEQPPNEPTPVSPSLREAAGLFGRAYGSGVRGYQALLLRMGADSRPEDAASEVDTP
jgi:sugar-specific transcriptional regulator TrmB